MRTTPYFNVKLALCVLAMLCPLLHGQVAVDAVYSGAGDFHFGSGTTLSATGMTVGASATCLVVGVEWGGTVTSPVIQWGGTTMSAAAVEAQASGESAWFYLTNPASGNLTISGSWTTSKDGYVTAISWTGTDTTSCVKTADNASSATTTVTVTSGANDATAALMTSNGNSTTPTNFTTLFDESVAANWGSGSYALGGTSNAHGFGGASTTSGAGIHIVAPAGGGGVSNSVNLSDSSKTYSAIKNAANRTAAITNATTGIASTTTAATYTTASFTPAANDLLVVGCGMTGTTAFTSVTDSLGGSYTQSVTALKATSADILGLFVANQLASGSAMTVSCNRSGATATGGIVFVARIAGMTRTGSDVVTQVGSQANQSASTPAPVFGSSVGTGNPTIGIIFNATSPATMTTPTGWTEQQDIGYSTPTTGGEYVSRTNGFSGTTVTWGSASGSAFSDVIAEFNAHVDNVVSIDQSSMSSDAVTAVRIGGGGTANLSETSTSAPTVTSIASHSNSLSETSTSSSAIATAAGRSTALSATSTSAPAVVTQVGRSTSLASTSTSALAIAEQVSRQLSLSSSSTSAPAIAVSPGLGIGLSDGSQSSDLISMDITLRGNLAFTMTSSPSVQASAGHGQSLSELSTTSPAIGVQSGKGAPISATSTSSPAVATLAAHQAAIADASVSSPTVVTQAAKSKAIGDSSTSAASVAVLAGQGRSISDSSTSAALVAVQSGKGKAIAQTSTSSDAISVSHSSGQRRRVVIISQLNSYGRTLTNSTTIAN